MDPRNGEKKNRNKYSSINHNPTDKKTGDKTRSYRKEVWVDHDKRGALG